VVGFERGSAVVASGAPNLDRFDLRAQVVKLVEFIVASNPAIEG